MWRILFLDLRCMLYKEIHWGVRFERKKNNKNNNKINRIEVKKMKERLKLRNVANLAKTSTETKIEPLGQNLFKGQKLSVHRFCTPVKH